MSRWTLEYVEWRRVSDKDAYGVVLSVDRDGEYLGLIEGRLTGQVLTALRRDHHLATDLIVVHLVRELAAGFEERVAAGHGPQQWQADVALFDIDVMALERVALTPPAMPSPRAGHVVHEFETD